MRKPNLNEVVTINGQSYSTAAMLREFVWGNAYWCQDEGTAAAFKRLTDKPEEQSEEDFKRVCDVLRSAQFPAHASIECNQLRILYVLTPSMP